METHLADTPNTMHISFCIEHRKFHASETHTSDLLHNSYISLAYPSSVDIGPEPFRIS